MSDKQNAPRGQREASASVKHWQSAVTVHRFILPTSTRQHLQRLAERAAMLAESDPNPERRAQHYKLLRWLARWIALDILKQVGRR